MTGRKIAKWTPLQTEQDKSSSREKRHVCALSDTGVQDQSRNPWHRSCFLLSAGYWETPAAMTLTVMQRIHEGKSSLGIPCKNLDLPY